MSECSRIGTLKIYSQLPVVGIHSERDSATKNSPTIHRHQNKAEHDLAVLVETCAMAIDLKGLAKSRGGEGLTDLTF